MAATGTGQGWAIARFENELSLFFRSLKRAIRSFALFSLNHSFQMTNRSFERKSDRSVAHLKRAMIDCQTDHFVMILNFMKK